MGRRTHTNLWAPGWVPSSQDEQLQGFEEKSQEPIPMGSWPRSWLPSRRFSRRFETSSARSGGLPRSETGPVFTAFRNALSLVGRRTYIKPGLLGGCTIRKTINCKGLRKKARSPSGWAPGSALGPRVAGFHGVSKRVERALGAPPLGNRAGFHGISKRDELGGGVLWCVKRARGTQPIFLAGGWV